MEDDMGMNFPELLVKVVYAAGGGEREKSEEAKGLDLSKITYSVLNNFISGGQQIMSFVISWPLPSFGKSSSL